MQPYDQTTEREIHRDSATLDLPVEGEVVDGTLVLNLLDEDEADPFVGIEAPQ